jgi:VWFA-related protein
MLLRAVKRTETSGPEAALNFGMRLVARPLRSACALSLSLFILALAGRAQQSDPPQPTLTVRTNLVLVPALVKTKKGDVVFSLTAGDFSLTDDGVPQRLNIDPEADSEPLALAICVETGGAGAGHIEDYVHLDAILDALVGDVEHRVALVGFDSSPHLLAPFTPETAQASLQLSSLRAGDSGAAILDAVAFAVAQLRTQPPRFRRAILLLSETIDHGSTTELGEALRLIGDTNTTLYSFAFSSTSASVSHEASKFGYNGSTGPGPAHGCFSRDGADAEYDGHYSRQVLDCLSQLAPPLRLATMAFLTARNALRTNTAASVAQLTGGEFFRFSHAKDLREGLIRVSHDTLNYYVLSFRPASPTPGLHTLHLQVRDRPQLVLKSRTEYWIDDDAGQ